MRRALRRAQEGVVLFIALIVLVAMSLAGVALLRGVDTGTIIAGNLAFRQTSMHVGDLGVEAARAWLLAQPSTDLQTDKAGSSYFATWQANLDLLGNDPSKPDYDWSSSVPIPAGSTYEPPSGYTVRYVLHRLCENSGDPTGSSANCVKVGGAAGTAASGTKGAAAYGTYAISVPTAAMYRITVRITGPRNSQSYVQATVY
ncbi:MAG: pilus assembly PilX family protein [Betaproteobacteria bacterium]